MQHMERSFHGSIHDLKSPLAYVYFSISALEEEELDMGKRQALLLTADKVSFLTGKINRILQAGRNFKEIEKEHKIKLFLFDIIKQIESEIQTMFPEKEILFRNNFDYELSIVASPDLLEAALRVLFENAVKYNSMQPVVTIRSRREDDTLIIEIEDNGCGTRSDRLRKLFKPYYSTDNKNGTGIGLYYAKSIINAHGGGKYMLRVLLKKVLHLLLLSLKYKLINMKKRKIKVLLVDDHILLGNAITCELDERGYEITFLNSVYGVDEAINRLSPDVLVFDVEIGKDNGITLAYNLYAGNPSLPILFISSHHEEKLKEESLLFAGAVAYLDKPFSINISYPLIFII